jgi:hypothetical protein
MGSEQADGPKVPQPASASGSANPMIIWMAAHLAVSPHAGFDPCGGATPAVLMDCDRIGSAVTRASEPPPPPNRHARSGWLR